jgi:hypothetical protein
LYNIHIINKTTSDLDLEMRTNIPGSEVKWVGEEKIAKTNELIEGTFFLILPKNTLDHQKEKIQLEFWAGDKLIGKTKTTFLGPANHH